MWETDSEQVPWGKDEKNFEKRVKKYLKLLRTKGWRLVMTRAIIGLRSIWCLWLRSFTCDGCRLWFGIRSFGSRSEWIRNGWNWRREGNLDVKLLELIARRLETVVDWGAEARALSSWCVDRCWVRRRWGTKFRFGRQPALGRRSFVALGILTKWSSFTRLETRTKESYIYASNRVENSLAQWRWLNVIPLAGSNIGRLR